MALSDYSTRLRARVDGLLRALVARVCDLQARALRASRCPVPPRVARQRLSRSNPCSDAATDAARAAPQPWEDNFAIALDFCTFHTRRHPFPEPDAVAIAASYVALSARFDVAAQLDKRAALDELLRRFRAAPLQCEAPVRFRAFASPRVFRPLRRFAF